MTKVYKSAADALTDIVFDGMVVMCGGFGGSGVPEAMIDAIRELGPRDLTIISNNAGSDGRGLDKLFQSGMVRKFVMSYPGENKHLQGAILRKEIEIELCPQGTLAERIRAGGAGIPAFLTPAGIATELAASKPCIEVEGREYLLEFALQADISIIRADTTDTEGNLIFRKAARNFNPIMATAAKVTAVEAREIVECGDLDPDYIHLPGIYVDRIIRSDHSNG